VIGLQASEREMSLLHTREYEMNNQNVEHAIIKQIEPLDVQGSTGIVQVIVKNINLICFSSSFVQFASITAEKKIRVILSLMTTQYSKNKEINPIKNIKSFQKSQTPNHCVLTGQVIGLKRKNNDFSEDKVKEKKIDTNILFYAIVDCNVHINVEILEKDIPQIGEFINAEGRLNIRLE